jgi:hypothetical protein
MFRNFLHLLVSNHKHKLNRLSMWVIKGAMVVDAAFFCFFVLCVLKNEVDWMKLGTNIWTARQLAILQVKFAVIVCYLSTHFSVIVLDLLIICCNAVVYVVWFRRQSRNILTQIIRMRMRNTNTSSRRIYL